MCSYLYFKETQTGVTLDHLSETFRNAMDLLVNVAYLIHSPLECVGCSHILYMNDLILK